MIKPACNRGSSWMNVINKREQATNMSNTTEYKYFEETGIHVFSVMREETPKGKKIYMRPSGSDNLKTYLHKIPYKLPEVLQAIQDNGEIWICEGEKCADILNNAGLTTTTNAGGAGKWYDSHSDYFKYTVPPNVNILPDNDKPGRDHSLKIAESLVRVADCKVKIIELPGLKNKQDVADWINAGNSIEDLIEIADKTPVWKAPSNEPENFYYERNRKEYLLKNNRGTWLTLTEPQFKKQLKFRGFSSFGKDTVLSEVDNIIIDTQNNHDIDYAGPLAGHKTGFYEINNSRILVTQSPVIIQSKDGVPFNTIINMLKEMLGSEQLPYFLSWLKIARESLISEEFRPGQAIVFAGERECGKSFTQNYIITPILGGRTVRPYAYMMGKTDFNGEMFTAEHLTIEDDIASTDIRIRREFGTQLKQITASDFQRCHAKHKQAITLKPFWRLSITVNDEPENLLILPPIDESIADKIILFKTERPGILDTTITSKDRERFRTTIRNELPGFIRFLEAYEIPKEIQSPRYGVTHYHNPEILDTIIQAAPETRLLDIIDRVLFADGFDAIWKGKASELETRLLDSEMKYEARRLLTWNNAAGTYLSRLARQYPERIKRIRGRQCNFWTIKKSDEQE